ncbi:P-loop ATPase, Sll1717 family [Pantoea sp. PNT01]|uniref:P-loop ATPase, Sll1717 family n=1 Tax=Pantoea sp. PNT01 TaxID=2769271 RepID=UPI001CE11CC0|nr:funZ protein [Pantoea sp. PNT01]
MKKIVEMEYVFPDAENYRRREFKDAFNRTFLVDEYIDELLKPEKSFLMGEKGTGKTAYAVYLSNNKYKNTASELKFIRETEYQKFVSLKKEKHLDLSDYTNIWRVILLLLLAKQVAENEPSIIPKFIKFKTLNNAIDEYYYNAFSPEIIHALNFVQEAKAAAEIMNKFAKASGEIKETSSFSESRFQTNLLYIQSNFEKAFQEIKLSENHILFIDGIDIRPHAIDYEEYLDCVKGLANAIWQLNNDFFPSIRDSKGRLRVILLIRPDIFTSTGLQNQNTKLRTNTVMLDWRTTYENFSSSKLYRMACKLLHSQQEKSVAQIKTPEEVWEHYFPYEIKSSFHTDKAFIGFLRNSFYRPRDIIMMLFFLQENCKEKGELKKDSFNVEDFDNSDFKRKLADYLLSEIKDQISFYYNDQDYELFIKFFEYLNGSVRFNQDEFQEAYKNLTEYVKSSGYETPKFMDSANKFLQFIYELNIISFIEDIEGHKPLIHWCFRDRSFANIAPKVKLNARYEIFYGLARAVNTGKKRLAQGEAQKHQVHRKRRRRSKSSSSQN